MKFSDSMAAIFITAIWGVNFSVIKLGLSGLDPFVLAGLRFLLCAVPTVFFIAKPDVPMKVVAFYGVIFGVGLWGMVNLGVYLGVSAGIASLVLQFSAFISIFLGYFLLKENITLQKLLGFCIALVGLGLIMTLIDGSVTIIGLLCVLLGALSWSVANIIIKKSGAKSVFTFLVWSCLFSPLPLFILAYLTSGNKFFIGAGMDLNAAVIFSVLFQVYPTTLIGYWIWNSLLKKYPVSSVAPLSLLVPVFGLVGSAVIFGEIINGIKILACILILLGLVIALYGGKLSSLWKKRVFSP